MLRELFYTGPSLAVLHNEYAAEGRVDPRAPVRSQSDAVLDVPADQIWAVLADIRSWSSWYPGFALLELTTLAPGGRMTWRLGRSTIRSTFARVVPSQELTWTGRALGANAVDRHTLTPIDEGRTRVTIEESLAGPVLPALYGAARLRAGHERWLSALATRMGAN